MTIKDTLKEFRDFINYLDSLILSLQNKYPQEFTCKPGCCDCCYAYFDVSILEAIYISEFAKDRITQEIRKKAYEYREQYLKQERLHPNRRRLKCPFLTDEKTCSIYEFRPVNCRIYGLPVSFNDVSHVCGLSKFEKRKTYDTIKMDRIQKFIFNLMQQDDNFRDFTRRVRLDELVLEISCS